jgi:D-glycero-D-manno-heptose 1,7-bisphosphate phosphatase
MRRAVFLDRDGTLIEDVGYLSDPARVVVVPGAVEALSEMRRKGWLVVVVTNQSGVARGMFTVADFERVNARAAELLGGFDAVYACFHLPEGKVAEWSRACACRKPLPGLVHEAARERGIDLVRSVGAGDSLRDVRAFRAAGVRAVLVRTGGVGATEQELASAGLRDVEVLDGLLPLAESLPLLATEAPR